MIMFQVPIWDREVRRHALGVAARGKGGRPEVAGEVDLIRRRGSRGGGGGVVVVAGGCHLSEVGECGGWGGEGEGAGESQEGGKYDEMHFCGGKGLVWVWMGKWGGGRRGSRYDDVSKEVSFCCENS